MSLNEKKLINIALISVKIKRNLDSWSEFYTQLLLKKRDIKKDEACPINFL